MKGYNMSKNKKSKKELKIDSLLRDLEEKINKQWLPSTNYNIKNNLKIELYKNNYCYIYLPIK